MEWPLYTGKWETAIGVTCYFNDYFGLFLEFAYGQFSGDIEEHHEKFTVDETEMKVKIGFHGVIHLH